MKFNLLLLISLGFVSLFMTSCGDDDSTDLTLNISGLEDLGDAAIYEGWIMVDGTPQTTGTFSAT